MNKNKSILICYYEVADYFVNVVNLLSKEVNVHLIHYPISTEAPFEVLFKDEVETYQINHLSQDKIRELFQKINPNLIFFAGWNNPIYNSLIPFLDRSQISLLGFDNSLNNSIEQLLKAKYFQLFKRKTFDFCFVPGEGQKKLARKMGFLENQIYTGAYTANVNQFIRIFEKKSRLEKSILYVGRYVKHKGIFELWDAFTELVDEGFNNWNLICAGAGDQWEKRKIHSNIKHLGFVQPNEMEPILMDTSIYVLPSHFEPWGVSVHEMAAAGFPLVLSDQIGSAEAFLEEGKNGISFPAKNKNALKAALKQMMQKSENELQEMGEYSHQLAQKITPQKWVETIQKILEDL